MQDYTCNNELNISHNFSLTCLSHPLKIIFLYIFNPFSTVETKISAQFKYISFRFKTIIHKCNSSQGDIEIIR